MYDDAYPTCARTFASLRLFEAGERPSYMWSTESAVASNDLRRHVDAVIAHISADEDLVRRVGSARGDIMCYWASATGHGGPTLSPTQMEAIAKYGLELWIDFYDLSGDT